MLSKSTLADMRVLTRIRILTKIFALLTDLLTASLLFIIVRDVVTLLNLISNNSITDKY